MYIDISTSFDGDTPPAIILVTAKRWAVKHFHFQLLTVKLQQCITAFSLLSKDSTCLTKNVSMPTSRHRKHPVK